MKPTVSEEADLNFRNMAWETGYTEINKAAAAISREAAGNNKHVAGSVGPQVKC